MRLKKQMKKGLFSLVAMAMAISSTFVDAKAIASEMAKANAQALLSTLTVEQKVGQMIQADTRWITPEEVVEYGIGSILSGGGASPENGNELSDWIERSLGYHQAVNEAGKIPLLYGVDAVHGHNNVYGATIFPHNIGLGAANDENLVKQIGEATSSEVLATGINWTFTPTVGVPHNERWGRTYETFGDDYQRVTALGAAYIEGIQSANKVLATAKHYLGEGLTLNGTNQGSVVLSDEDYADLIAADLSNPLVKELLTPYIEAINDGVKSIMISYNTINGVKCHGNKDVVTTLLKEKLGFEGIVISDYNGLDQVHGDTYADKVYNTVNAGLDMLMVADMRDGRNAWEVLYETLLAGVNNGQISTERLDDAVLRILTAKYELGIMDDRTLTYPSIADQALFGSDEHRTIARKAVAQSLTLLKNTQMGDVTAMEALDDMSKVVVAGTNGNNIGNQCGGWTITWQGASGNTTVGTTIYQGIKEALQAKGGQAYYAANGYFEYEGVEAAIVVAGETPYAESNGDRTAGQLKLSTTDINTINTIKEDHPDLPIYLVLVTGRPITIADQVVDESIDAIVSAWLPGSEGAGVADVLFGTKDFTATNPITWPWYAKDIETKLTDESKVLYPVGYGLTKSEISTTGEKPADPDVIVFDSEGTTRIEAENAYDMSSGITLENNGTTVGYLENGRYLTYKISTSKDLAYTFVINANAQDDQTDVFELYVDDKLIMDNTMDVPGVGNWTTFSPLEVGTVSIPAGEHTLKLLAKAKDFNLDWYEFTVSDAEYVPPQEPEEPAENVGTGAILTEDGVSVTMSSSENSGSGDWYYGNQKIENKNETKDSLDIRTEDNSEMTTINVDDTVEYNTFLGMGTSVDESTVYNLWKMDEDVRYEFIKRLVDPVNGSGNTLFRLTIGTADFTAQPFYTYYDGTGTELNGQPDWYNETGFGFSIQKDIDYHIIETIQMIQKAAKECGVEDELKFFASPWSPPGWMKQATSNSNSYENNELLLKGGRLKDEYIDEAAKYYVRFIEEYAKLGIPIYAMTLQNEPMLEIDYPSCLMSATQAAKLSQAIKAELAASSVLSEEAKDVKVWAFDHNPGDLNAYMNTAYTSTGGDTIDGAAVHDYGGELSNMTTLHNNYRDKSIHLTERSVWGTTGMDRIIQYLRNYAESYNCWVTMLDSNINTHQWVGTPDPTAFVQDANDVNNYWATPEVYLMSQFSKYIRPGFVRVSSNYGSSSTITNVVFKNPETDELIMVAVNNTASDQNFKVVNNGIQFNATLPAYNCATYIWKASSGQPKGIAIPGTLTPGDAKTFIDMDQNTHFENVKAGANATYLVDVKETGWYNVTLNHAIGSNGWPWTLNNTEDKVIVLNDANGNTLGTFNTKRFDTWSRDYAEWGTYFDAQMQVYLEKGVQNLVLLTKHGDINLGNLVFTKAVDNTVPGYINAVDYVVGKNILIENNRGNIGFVEADDYFEYRIHVQKAGTYAMEMTYGASNGANFNLYLDGSSTPLMSNVSLLSTGSYATYGKGTVNNVVLPEGEHTLRFVVNAGGEFNFRSFSFGPYIDVTYESELVEGQLKNKVITVNLVNGTFVDTLDEDQWSIDGLTGHVDFTLTRVNDTQVEVELTSEVSQDFDTDLAVKLIIDASQVVNQEGYVLSDELTIKAVNDAELLTDVVVAFEDTSFDLVLTGGTYKETVTKDDIVLSDSLMNYVSVESVEIVNGQLTVKLNRNKTNYVDIAGTVTLKTQAYNDANQDLEAQVTLVASPDGPKAIVVGKDAQAKLDASYDNNGSLASAQSGTFENFWLDVKDAGEYILEFDITNNLGADTASALSINGGNGIGVNNNLASLHLGRYYNNGGISYRTILNLPEGNYNLQLKANADIRLTNPTLTYKPDPVVIEDQTTLNVDAIIDGNDNQFWAIENGNNIGYTSTGSYQDYYVNVKEAGDYLFSISYANTGDAVVELLSVVDGKETSLGTVALASTGGWGSYKTSDTVTLQLSAGVQVLRSKVYSGGFNTGALFLEFVPVIIPDITVETTDAKVYVGEDATVEQILGLQVTFNGQDVTADSSIVTIETDYDASKAGEYNVSVTAKDSKGNPVVKEYTITVVHVPTMTYYGEDVVVNGTFDPLKGVIIYDIDKSVITDIQVENNVDVTKAGTYEVIYTIVDGLGNTATFVRKVNVIEQTEQVPGGIVDTSDSMNMTPYILFAGISLLAILESLKKRVAKR